MKTDARDENGDLSAERKARLVPSPQSDESTEQQADSWKSIELFVVLPTDCQPGDND
jgi:hypothetical protein